MRTRRICLILAGVLVFAVLPLVLVACGSGKGAEPFKDAPRSGERNNAPAGLISFPDGFSNASSKCDGPNRVYVAFHGDSKYAAIAVVPGDPRCARGTLP